MLPVSDILTRLPPSISSARFTKSANLPLACTARSRFFEALKGMHPVRSANGYRVSSHYKGLPYIVCNLIHGSRDPNAQE